MQIVKLQEVDSTNRYLSQHSDEFPELSAVIAGSQTAGRGQRGNSWESEPGLNATLSIIVHPAQWVKPSEQFVISQVVAVALVETLRMYMPELTPEIAVKWPNDIYVGDRKICGILIENVIQGGSLVRSIIGIGLNVNQQAFLSDAPNPVSMAMLTGKTYDVELVARSVCDSVERFLRGYCNPPRHARLRSRYFSMLWRSSGYHPYMDAATGQRFDGRISNIASDGRITLTDRYGTPRTYAFKEVRAVLSDTLL